MLDGFVQTAVIEDGSVVHEVFYPHPPERVWRALTDPRELAAWTRPDAATPFEVVEVDPPHQLCWRCATGSVEAEVRFDLTPEGGGTRLRVQHRGLPGKMGLGTGPEVW